MKKQLVLMFALFFTIQAQSQSILNETLSGEERDEESFYKTNTSVRKPSIKENSDWKNGAWALATRYQYKYAKDNLIETLYFKSPFSDTTSRTSYKYDSQNRLEEVIIEIQNTFDPSLQNKIKYIYTYFTKNANTYTQRVTQNYNASTNQWENKTRYTYGYNSRGHNIETLNDKFLSNTWILQNDISTKVYYEYLNSLSDKIILKIDSVYKADVMQPTYKYASEYNSSGIEIKKINYQFTTKWDTLSFEIVENDSTGIPISVKRYSKLNQDNFFSEYQRVDSLVWNNFDLGKSYYEQTPISYCKAQTFNGVYDYSNKQIINYTDSYGSNAKTIYTYKNSLWVPEDKEVNIYSIKLDLLQNDKYYYTNNNWDLFTSNKYNIVYNNDELMEVVMTAFNKTSNTYVNVTKLEYINYVNTGFHISNNTIETSLYPNPSTNGSVNINVNLEAASALSIKVSDMKGSIVYTDERNVGKGLNTIELKNLGKGMYVVELTTEFGVSKTKLIVQ